MLLRRIIEHVRTQNWTAVALDFFIVVVGVFIGTNVTNWNDARQLQERSQEYVMRLLSDLEIEYEYAKSINEYYATAREASVVAFDGLTGRSKYDDRTILINAFRATQYQWYETRRAAYDELVSSGDLGLIRDPKLRDIAVRYYGNSSTAYELMQYNGQHSEYRRLFEQIVDPNIRSALHNECGDREYTSAAGVSGIFTIAYSCALESINDEAVKNAVAALGADANFIPALRRQAANYESDSFNMDYILEFTGLNALFLEESDS